MNYKAVYESSELSAGSETSIRGLSRDSILRTSGCQYCSVILDHSQHVLVGASAVLPGIKQPEKAHAWILVGAKVLSRLPSFRLLIDEANEHGRICNAAEHTCLLTNLLIPGAGGPRFDFIFPRTPPKVIACK
jgi:hypothetical protein